MRLKGLLDEDFVNYKESSMFLISPFCDFKCDREYGSTICQNSDLAKSDIITIDNDELITRYLENDITTSVVIGGLEPLINGWFEEDLLPFIYNLRVKNNCSDTVVIYTGYNKNEVESKIDALKKFNNIIIKFGRFIPNQKSRYDDILGINLVSDNQYAEKIS